MYMRLPFSLHTSQSPPHHRHQRLVRSGSLLVKPLLSQSHSSLPAHTPADLLFGPHE